MAPGGFYTPELYSGGGGVMVGGGAPSRASAHSIKAHRPSFRVNRWRHVASVAPLTSDLCLAARGKEGGASLG